MTLMGVILPCSPGATREHGPYGQEYATVSVDNLDRGRFTGQVLPFRDRLRGSSGPVLRLPRPNPRTTRAPAPASGCSAP
jgi:hypothetical protein